jgi:hypothetical protein
MRPEGAVFETDPPGRNRARSGGPLPAPLICDNARLSHMLFGLNATSGRFSRGYARRRNSAARTSASTVSAGVPSSDALVTGKHRPGSRPLPFSSGQARRACMVSKGYESVRRSINDALRRQEHFINLSRRQLTALPPEIRQLTALQVLRSQRKPTDSAAAGALQLRPRCSPICNAVVWICAERLSIWTSNVEKPRVNIRN